MSKKQSSVPRYMVLTRIWSYQHGQYFEPGEVVEFDLSDAAEYKPDIDRLVAKGVIELYTGSNLANAPRLPDDRQGRKLDREWPVPIEPSPEIVAETEVTNA